MALAKSHCYRIEAGPFSAAHARLPAGWTPTHQAGPHRASPATEGDARRNVARVQSFLTWTRKGGRCMADALSHLL